MRSRGRAANGEADARALSSRCTHLALAALPHPLLYSSCTTSPAPPLQQSHRAVPAPRAYKRPAWHPQHPPQQCSTQRRPAEGAAVVLETMAHARKLAGLGARLGVPTGANELAASLSPADYVYSTPTAATLERLQRQLGQAGPSAPIVPPATAGQAQAGFGAAGALQGAWGHAALGEWAPWGPPRPPAAPAPR